MHSSLVSSISSPPYSWGEPFSQTTKNSVNVIVLQVCVVAFNCWGVSFSEHAVNGS
jgi:hypothetical protein